MTTPEARAAQREKRWAEQDARARETLAMEQEIDHALRLAEQLPQPLGQAITELFGAVEPQRMSDGYLSASVVGKHSPEMMKLARAVISVAQG